MEYPATRAWTRPTRLIRSGRSRAARCWTAQTRTVSFWRRLVNAIRLADILIDRETTQYLCRLFLSPLLFYRQSRDRMVGRGRRENLCGRRIIPQSFRHGDGRVFRIRVVRYGIVYPRLSQHFGVIISITTHGRIRYNLSRRLICGTDGAGMPRQRKVFSK